MSADPEEIPLSRGTYNINWDEIDENVNPFVTKTKVSGSPPAGAALDEVPLPPPPAVSDFNELPASNNVSSFGVDLDASASSLKDCSNNSSSQRPKKTALPKKKRPTAASDKSSPAKSSAPSGLRERIREMKRQQRLQQQQPELAEGGNCQDGFVPLGLVAPEPGVCGDGPASLTPPPPPPAPPPSQLIVVEENDDDALPSLPPAPPAVVQEDEEVSVKLMKPPPPMPPPRAPTTTVSTKPKPQEPPLPPPPMEDSEEEEFYPAEEAFRADFLDALEKKTMLTSQTPLDGPRESVIVKFDPLFKSNSPAIAIPAPFDGPAASDNASSSPALPPPPDELLNGPQTDRRLHEHDAFSDLPPPPKHDDFLPEVTVDQESDRKVPYQEANLLGTPQRNPLDSSLPNPVLTATAEVDRMLAFSPSSPSTQRRGLQPVTPAAKKRIDFEEETSSEAMKFSESDIVRIRQEMQMDFQAQLLEKERQWDERVRNEETEKQRLREQTERLTKDCDEMKICVIEYEKTLQDFLAQKSDNDTVSKDSVEKIMKERDQAIEDTDTIERAFNDLHRRYDKSKQVIEAIKANEETLKKCLEESQLKLKRQGHKYQTLKQHAEERLEHASREIEKTRKTNEAEILKLQSALKKAELQVKGLEAQVEQKVKENDELTKICDELIAKCGR